MKGIKGLIFRNNDTKYFCMGMRSDLHGFLNLHQGGMTVTDYHKWRTAKKELAEEFRYKVGDINGATNRECEASGIKMSDTEYNENCADASEVAREKFLADTFLLGEEICQYRGMIIQLRNDCTEGQ